MKQGDEILALAQQQRVLLLECVLEERQAERLPPALKAVIAVHDELIRVLETACREKQLFHDDAGRYEAPRPLSHRP